MPGLGTKALHAGVQLGLERSEAAWVVIVTGGHVASGMETLFLLNK